MKKLVVLTGAGISAESGIRTFRDAGGMWEEYDVMEVASIDGWEANPELVLRFYNERRKQLAECVPNDGHTILAELEKYFEVEIITQNVDDLHERAGSSKILHLHGELKKVRSTADPELIYELDGWRLDPGDVCEKGAQLRPHIVWFGEAVPEMGNAVRIAEKAEVFAVIGTSLNVYPAASIINFVPYQVPVFLIDPNDVPVSRNVRVIKEKASTGVKMLAEILKKEFL
jgi:NAD-dependent deacetylase